ncbi:MAG: enoyl-CoA hydratase-related protein [Alkalilacustris sp.]
MEYRTIALAEAQGIAVITLNRPDVLNALNAVMRAELRDALERAGTTARVVVLTGAGQAFCAGQDLGDGPTVAAVTLEQLLRDEYHPLVRAIVECPVPVVAAVNGTAAGAGASLALLCDVVIAAESARFVQAFARIGLMPDAGATWMLPRLVGPARALGAALFAEPVPARQAADWGMIWEAVPDDGFEARWRLRAGQLAQGPTLAYREMRGALRTAWAQDLDAHLEEEASRQGRCGRSRDFSEGLLAFAERRPAVFEGR